MQVLEKILTSAIELFRQYGFKTITVDDIARRAGISKKTLYQHFANKDEIVSESVKAFHLANCNHIDGIMAGSSNALEAIMKITALLDEMYRKINPLSMLELQRFYPDAFNHFRTELMKRDVACIQQNLRQGMAEGLYRESLNVPLLALYRIESCLLLFQPGAQINERFPHHVINHEITELFLYGIITPKGEKLYRKYKDTYFKQAA